MAAFQAFFSGLSPNTEPGMAFVLVQHMDAVHKSLLPELVQRFTSLPVFQVTDGVLVQPNQIYIIPPGQGMSISGGALRLFDQPPLERGLRLSINVFLNSLAEDQKTFAVAVILSGTGSDGSLGIKAIRHNGGFVLVQDSKSAEYGGMPESAAKTGQVNTQTSPEKMIATIDTYFKRKKTPNFTPIPDKVLDPDSLQHIFTLLKTQTKRDFSQYKPTTIRRRIERRMEVQKIPSLVDYRAVLDRNPDEVEELFNDLLIGVTSFFRDPGIFETLRLQVIPKLLSGRPPGTSLRVWSAGCSTGEEAYSLAILLQESLEELELDLGVQIFATDIDKRAIALARTGIYLFNVATDLTVPRLQRFFIPSHDQKKLRISKTIRNLVIFSDHDILNDPPFFKLDLLVCRNLLIYFGLELQKRLIPLFHYAMNPGGILFLGTSETIGEFGNLFQPLDREGKFYIRREGPSKLGHHFGAPVPTHSFLERPSVANFEKSLRSSSGTSLQTVTEEVILSALDMAAALVNEQGEVFYFHGKTGYFLEPAVGATTHQNILKMAKEGLKHPISMALHRAAVKNEVVRSHEVRVTWKDLVTEVLVSVHPLKKQSPPTAEPLFLVLLEERPLRESSSTATDPVGKAVLDRLAEQLKVQEGYLQSSTEQMESSNEELRASNEELQSVNEELQSTNEELDTSKEELQSVNEELSTVNSELNSKISILSTTVNDMNNLLSATGVATVFVDLHLNILRFTPEATRIINLFPGDVGRPVGHLTSNLVNYQTLEKDAQTVLDTLVWFEVEVQTSQDAWYRLRIQPYRTTENVIEGAVISFGDITEIIRQRQVLEKNNKLLRMVSVVQDSQDPIIVQDMDGKILAWNPTAVTRYGWTEEEALAMNFREHIPKNLQVEALQKIREIVYSDVLETYQTQRLTKDGRIIEISVTSSALVNKDGKIYAISTIERVKGTRLDP